MCPDWCSITHVTHEGLLEIFDGAVVHHSDESDDGWSLTSITLPDGTPDPDPGMPAPPRSRESRFVETRGLEGRSCHLTIKCDDRHIAPYSGGVSTSLGRHHMRMRLSAIIAAAALVPTAWMATPASATEVASASTSSASSSSAVAPARPSITDWRNVGCANLQGYRNARICLQYSPSNRYAARGVFYNKSQSRIENQGIFVNLGPGANKTCSASATPAGERRQCKQNLNGRYTLQLNYRKGTGAMDSVRTSARTFG